MHYRAFVNAQRLPGELLVIFSVPAAVCTPQQWLHGLLCHLWGAPVAKVRVGDLAPVDFAGWVPHGVAAQAPAMAVAMMMGIGTHGPVFVPEHRVLVLGDESLLAAAQQARAWIREHERCNGGPQLPAPAAADMEQALCRRRGMAALGTPLEGADA